MKSSKELKKGGKRIIGLIVFALFYVFTGCKAEKKEIEKEIETEPVREVVEIVTNNMDFQVADSISSGWHTFKYDNRSGETHFFLLDKYPEGRTIEDTEKEVGPIFQLGMDLINEGKAKEGFEAFNKLPEWFFKVAFVGGSGLVSPQNSSLTTLKLDPGYYIIECYVKMQNGKFHSNMGMAKALVVTNEISQVTPPEPTLDVLISSTDGIIFKDTISSGSQVFSVYFKDQITHENFVGHDVNLVRIDENADISILEAWMNWADPKGLISPAPEGFTFLGGVNDMVAGSTGYFEVNLAPGHYALISEVPMARSKNLFKPFVVIN